MVVFSKRFAARVAGWFICLALVSAGANGEGLVEDSSASELPEFESFLDLHRDKLSSAQIDALGLSSRRDTDGNSLLHFAASKGDVAAAKFFLEQKLDPLVENVYGLNALDTAIGFGHGEMLDLFLAGLELADFPSGTGIFGDPRVAYWGYLYFADQHEKLLRLVEQDLNFTTPHPLSGYIWTVTHSRRETLRDAFSEAAPKLKQVLGRNPEVEMLWYDDQVDEILARFGETTDFGESDIYVLVQLVNAAQETEQYELSKQYLETAIKLFPDLWQFPWMYENRLHDDPNLLARAIQFSKDPEIQGTLTGDYVKEISAQYSWASEDRLATQLNSWREQLDDPRLRSSLAFNYASKWRYEQALPHMLKGVIRFPWYSNSLTPMFYVARINQEERAKRYALLTARWYETEPSQIEARAISRFASQLISEGNKGLAREHLERALKDHPDNQHLVQTMAELEEADERWPEAVSWAEKALSNDILSSADTLLLLLKALARDGNRHRVIELYESAVASGKFVSLDVHLEGLSALKETGRLVQFEQRLEVVYGLFPDAIALGKLKAELLWKQKNNRDAFQLVEQLLNRKSEDSDLIKLALQYATEIYQADYVEQWLAGKVAAQPWNQALAREYLSLTKPNAELEDKVSYWRDVQTRNPSRFFACRNEVMAYVQAREYSVAWDVANQCIADAETAKASVSEQLSSARYKIYTLEQWSKRRRLDQEFVQAAAKEWREVVTRYNESLSNHYRYEEQICQALQDTECAAEALYQSSMLRKSSTSIFHDLVAKYRGELDDYQTLGYGARMLARDPYDVGVVNSFLHKHIRWSGSAIVALKAITEAKARGLSPASSYERDALGQLGDPYSRFKGYVNGTYPGESQRYVNWFERARRSALNDESKQIRYLFEDDGHPGVEVILANGEVAVRRDHGVFGKIAFLGKGAGFVKFEYTDLGQLSSVEESSGKRVELVYNEEGEIERFYAADGQVLVFTYNETGQPLVIAIEGIGSMNVSYNPDGSMAGVESDQGHQMAMQVTAAFQQLLSLVNYARQANQLDQLPSFEFLDEELLKLRDRFEAASYGSSKHRAAEEDLAAYLVEHIKDSNDYFWEVQDLLTSMIEYGKQSKSKKDKLRAARAVRLWHELHHQVKPHGLPEYEFSVWSEMRNWLVAYSLESRNKDAADLLADIDARPLSLLRDAHWLNRSSMSNSAFWKRSGDDALTGSKQNPAEKQAVLIRANGDVVVGTKRGLSVRRQGHWQWFGFDDNRARFSNNISPSQISDTSDVLSLTETEDGTLWIGTARGLIAVSGDYQSNAKRWRTNQDGMPSPRVISLAALENQIYVGTASGIVVGRYSEGLRAFPQGQSLVAHKIVSVQYTETPTLIIQSGQDLDLVTPEAKDSITRDAQLFAYGQDTGIVYWQDSNGLIKSRMIMDYESEIGVGLRDELPTVLARPTDLLMSKQVHELQVWPIPELGETLVVNTDIAVNVLNNSYFQAMALPYEVTRGGLDVGPKMSTYHLGDVVALTDEGVYRFAPSEVTQLQEGPVLDILTDDEYGITYVATGDSLKYIDHDQRDYLQWLNGASASRLAQDREGNLITHDYNTILMIPRGETQPKELFDASPSPEEEGWGGLVNDLMVDSNGIIWVASGSSVFRFDGEKADEFNYLLDAEAFPSRSNMIYRIYEDNVGDIYAVASDEGHLTHNGVDLSGGAMKWDGQGFENVGQDPHWFTTSYTKIADDTAIVGTVKTLVREKSGSRQSFTELQDATFAEMRKITKMLWLAGEGARLGESDSWLFPTAGGVAVYHEGQWFYPDRLNQLLPEDQGLGQYGARTAHAVSVDKDGTVYVGTDLGLLVYHADGIESLLTDNYRGQMAFSSQELMKHREVSDVFLGAIKADSPQGKLLNRFEELDGVISRTQKQLEVIESEAPASSGDPNAKPANPESLKQRLRENERNRQRLLARMEKEEPGLFQMLRFDPREASAMNEKLTEDQALIQFLPTRKTLQIQVVTSDGAVIRQVEVDRDELMRKSLYAAAALRDGVLDLYDFKTRSGKTENAPSFADIEELDIDISWEMTRERLAWLYDRMFRPIERDLAGKEKIFVTSVGSLTYLPFGALIRDNSETVEYAVQRFNIGVLPSLFHYGLVVDYEESYAADVLFISDPDGSLPGARQEVQSISDQMYDEKVILEGEAATMNAVDQYAPESRIVHFATHGVLDEDSPADSYLLLADQRRLSVVDISTMDLSQTDIVVLSACESGIGGSGLEYATLARAFAHAKVPTVLASYWEVHDEATRLLMTNFYGVLQENDDMDYFSALSHAQRAMIAEGGKASHPSAWSGFSIFGRP